MRHQLQSDDSTLHGVQVVEVGEAEGHDFAIGEEFLSAVVELGNAGPVKVRMNHPEGRGDVASIVGEASNFVIDGKCVRADVKLFDLPEKSRLMTLATQAGHLFGMSLDFAGELVKKAGTKLKQMTCEKIFAVDFVDTPAATRALFSRGEGTGHWRAVCSLSLPEVDSNKQMETIMAKDKKQLAEDVTPKADVETPHAEPDGDEGYEKIMSSLAGIEKRLSALEKPVDVEEKEELAKEEPPVEDEKKEEAMATMAAKVCSIMLAKVGVRARPVKSDASVDGDKGKEEHQLSADEEKLAKSLGLDESGRKQFAANIAASKRKQI
jgi:hypothetical protein